MADVGCSADVEEDVGRGYERVVWGAHELRLENRSQAARELAALQLVLRPGERLESTGHLRREDAQRLRAQDVVVERAQLVAGPERRLEALDVL